MICDLHNDILTSGLSDTEIKVYLDSALKYCDILTLAVWTSEFKPSLLSLREIFFNAQPPRHLRCHPSIEGNFSVGSSQLKFAVEDMGFLEDGDIEGFFNLPIIYAGLVWNKENKFGGGAFSDANLTEKGGAVISIFNKRAQHLDFAHMNKKTFYEAADLYKKPILCSHTCFQSCVPKDAPFNHIAKARNLDDGQIKLIVQSGGLIGLTFVATFLNGAPECSSGDIARHIDWFVQKHGYKNLAIGTDYFGTKELPADILDYKDFHAIADKLSRLGYSAETISDIFSGNYKRFVNIPFVVL